MQDDYIKLGRSQFRILKTCENGRNLKQNVLQQLQQPIKSKINEILQQENESFHTLKTEENDNSVSSIQQNESIQKSKCPNICKICLSEFEESENPLINPCECSGSMQYVHLECLQYWIQRKDTYTIGRSHHSDIIINDLSVSRIHATLKFYPGSKELYIKDNNSKFGTLVLLRENIQLNFKSLKKKRMREAENQLGVVFCSFHTLAKFCILQKYIQQLNFYETRCTIYII
ncbi:hypothetical protein IMG5_182310 [Ichthyophthirius multifiliis]|uniref:Zinc finger protein n=1 Tax=Ichthyophthirius multifiliis TaxID=5932 RepID=G0R315_ICHMU|nr:hypothetical protein IMG5_182310 [Ichthyophthirius multifiliis]EGR28147.1 hypothetical protein IMG5_182310 [Ichthyophthirius multifiliis]|eukprot:XP_004027492.1 hypothetical protein IMG5_182310 [Ichthyophthirius multifiliis]